MEVRAERVSERREEMEGEKEGVKEDTVGGGEEEREKGREGRGGGGGWPHLAGQDKQNVGLNAGQLEDLHQLEVGREYALLFLRVSLPLLPLEQPHQGSHSHKHHAPEEQERGQVHYPALLGLPPAEVGVAKVLGLEGQERGVT